jgi:transcriptional regulator with XRE-family HTH domain
MIDRVTKRAGRGQMRRMSKRRSDVAMLTVWAVRLLRVREALGIKQKDLAADTGVGFKTLSNWEHGHAPPSPWFLVKLEEKYGVGPDYILCGKLNGLSEDIRSKLREMADQ